jgi:hypothetical protein
MAHLDQRVPQPGEVGSALGDKTRIGAGNVLPQRDRGGRG